MSYVLKQNNEQIAISGGWNPNLFGNLTKTSYPKQVSQDFVWKNDGYWLGWIPDPEPVPHVPSQEEQFEEIRHALQAAIDAKAAVLGFKGGGNVLMIYAGFSNPFQPLAQTFAEWEATVWVEAETYRQEVIAGTKPMLNAEQAIAMMPPYVG